MLPPCSPETRSAVVRDLRHDGQRRARSRLFGRALRAGRRGLMTAVGLYSRRHDDAVLASCARDASRRCRSALRRAGSFGGGRSIAPALAGGHGGAAWRRPAGRPAPEHHPVGEALVLVGDVAELVVDHIADQGVGLVGAGLGDQQLLAVGAGLALALAEQGGARGAFRLQFLRPRLAGRRRAQRDSRAAPPAAPWSPRGTRRGSPWSGRARCAVDWQPARPARRDQGGGDDHAVDAHETS